MHLKIAPAACAVLFQISTASAQVAWTLVATSGPTARDGIAMAYDSLRGRAVLFGGHTLFGLSSETWEWDGTTWTLASTSGPTPRQWHAMAFDSARGKTVLFGGITATGTSDETWEWNGVGWSLLAMGSPPPTAYHAMTFDTERDRTILFGGQSGAVLSGDTWAWNGSTWVRTASSGPSPRAGMSVAFDTHRGVAVLFGGVTVSSGLGVFLSDTWTWNGSSWQQQPGGPGPRAYHAASYDLSRRRVVLFGGYGPALGDTWEWDGAQWHQASVPGPSNRYGHAMAFDPVVARTVTFGGVPATTPNDTWSFGGGGFAAATQYGLGCGTIPPAIGPFPGSRPLLGQVQLSTIKNVPFGFAAIALGVTNQSLPVDFVGINGCTLLNGAELEVGSFCQSTSVTTAQHSLAIPYDINLVGVHVYLQAWTIAPGVNPLGIAMSNGVELVLGDV